MDHINDWVLIYSSQIELDAKLAEDTLKQRGIESHIATQIDPVVPAIGLYKLYTPVENVEKAVEVLKEVGIKQ